jgi:uncharacterized protein (DUF433 family)
MTAVTNPFIVLDERGRAWIDGANTKVIEVAKDSVGHGWSPEEIHFQHPHLSLAQIHAALSFYHEHKADFDRQMERDTREANQMRAAQGETPLEKRLRENGALK